jgi:PKD repeat protein
MALLVGVLISGCIEEEVNAAPVADFTSSVEHNTSTAGGTVNFTDASTDADGDTLTYSWEFGDNTTNTTQSPTHTYAANGTYTVNLTVSDGTDTGTKSADVIVGNVAPTASFTYVATNLSVNFTDTSTDPNTGDTLTWSWNFGDDSALNTTQNPIYAYAAAGTYNVTLTVTDSYSSTDVSDITAITVTE